MNNYEPDLMWVEGCPCREGPHLLTITETREIDEAGPVVMVTVPERGAWIVPRLWMVAHNPRVTDIPALARLNGWERAG